MTSTAITIEELRGSAAGALRVEADLRQDAALLFQPDAQLQILPAHDDQVLHSSDLSASLPVAWLPRGRYRLDCRLHGLDLPAGDYRLRLILFAEMARERTVLADRFARVSVERGLEPSGESVAWNRDRSMPL